MCLNQNKKKYSLCVIPYLPFVLGHKSKITIAKSKQFDDSPLAIFTLLISKEQVSNFIIINKSKFYIFELTFTYYKYFVSSVLFRFCDFL